MAKLPCMIDDDTPCCPTAPTAFRRDLTPYVSLCKALADETRLALLGQLASSDGPRCVCELEAPLDVSQPTVSHHLKVLREAGVVTSERRGTWMYYAIDPRALERLAALLSQLGGHRG